MTMDRITRADMRNSAYRLTRAAREARLVLFEETIEYVPGNKEMGITAKLQIKKLDGTVRQGWWLPRFGLKDLTRTQFKATEAAVDALIAACDMQRELAKNKVF